MPAVKRIAPCLWFDDQAEEAAKFYVSVFGEGSAIDSVAHYGKEGFEQHGRPEGSVSVVTFRLQGQPFTALNGGPHFHFTEAISLQIFCETQGEVDHYWSKLTEGGSEGPCGWLKDRYGLSWQIVPADIETLMSDTDRAASERVMREVMNSSKPDLDRQRRAHAGKL